MTHPKLVAEEVGPCARLCVGHWWPSGWDTEPVVPRLWLAESGQLEGKVGEGVRRAYEVNTMLSVELGEFEVGAQKLFTAAVRDAL